MGIGNFGLEACVLMGDKRNFVPRRSWFDCYQRGEYELLSQLWVLACMMESWMASHSSQIDCVILEMRTWGWEILRSEDSQKVVVTETEKAVAAAGMIDADRYHMVFGCDFENWEKSRILAPCNIDSVVAVVVVVAVAVASDTRMVEYHEMTEMNSCYSSLKAADSLLHENRSLAD